MHSHTHASTVRTHTHAHTPSVSISVSPLLSLLHFSAWWVLECHYDFCYQKQTAGLDWEAHARHPVFHTESAAACRVLFWSFRLFSFPINGPAFFKAQIYWQSSCCEAQSAHVVYFLNGKPHLRVFTVQSLSLGLSVNEDDFISTGKFDPICVMHRQTAQVNDIIELMSYTPLSAVHSYGQPEAWRLSASYTGYCMFDESLEGRIW